MFYLCFFDLTVYMKRQFFRGLCWGGNLELDFRGSFSLQHFREVQPGKSSGVATLSKQSQEGAWGLREGGKWAVRCPWLRQMRLKGDSHKAQIFASVLQECSICLHCRENECAFSEASELRTQRGVGGSLKRKPHSAQTSLG